jgi:hypothetical protein
MDIDNLPQTIMEYASLYGLKVIAAIAIFMIGKSLPLAS